MTGSPVHQLAASDGRFMYAITASDIPPILHVLDVRESAGGLRASLLAQYRLPSNWNSDAAATVSIQCRRSLCDVELTPAHSSSSVGAAIDSLKGSGVLTLPQDIGTQGFVVGSLQLS